MESLRAWIYVVEMQRGETPCVAADRTPSTGLGYKRRLDVSPAGRDPITVARHTREESACIASELCLAVGCTQSDQQSRSRCTRGVALTKDDNSLRLESVAPQPAPHCR